MRNQFAVAVVFAVAIMMTFPLDGFILPSTAVAQQQQINSNTSSQVTNTSSSPLPLKTIFKQVENSVVQITSKIPITTGVLNRGSSQLSLGKFINFIKPLYVMGRIAAIALVARRRDRRQERRQGYTTGL